jgi:carboxylesterase type B
VHSEAAAVIGTELLDRLGARLGNDDTFVPITSADLLAQQLAVNAETLALLAAGGVAPDLLTLCFGTTFYPVYGTDVLPEPALDVIANGAARDIDLLVGTTADEWTMFVPPGDAAKYALKQALAVADAAFTPTGRTGAEVLGSYRRHRPGHSDLDSIIPFMTDFAFRIPAIRLAETAQRHNPRTYMFQFAWKGQFGAVHGLDVPFMFDSLEKARNVVAALGAPNPPQSLATTMHGACVNFIKNGSPQHPSLPEWPASAGCGMAFSTKRHPGITQRGVTQLGHV